MTKEEAILLSAYTGYLLVSDFAKVHKFCEETFGRPILTHEFADNDVQNEIREKLRPQIMELVKNIAAPCPVSREQVEKVWRGEWEFPIFKDGDVNDPRCKCSECGSVETPLARHRFCPSCGAPMTDEAVQTVMDRLEVLYGEKEDG